MMCFFPVLVFAHFRIPPSSFQFPFFSCFCLLFCFRCCRGFFWFSPLCFSHSFRLFWFRFVRSPGLSYVFLRPVSCSLLCSLLTPTMHIECVVCDVAVCNINMQLQCAMLAMRTRTLLLDPHEHEHRRSTFTFLLPCPYSFVSFFLCLVCCFCF